MDLNNFKLLKEDSDNYDIGHPNGKKLTVSKKSLSEKAHGAIKKLAWGGKVKKYDDGGNVSSSSDVPEDTAQTPSQMMTSLMANPSQMQIADNDAPQGGGEISAPQNGAPAGSDPLIQQKYDQAALLNKEENDLRNSAGQEQKLNNDQAGFYQDYANKLAGAQTPEDIANGYKAKDDALTQAYANNKIDPERYYKNMSTGSRIAAGIGIMLAGAQSGFTGQNIALNELNKAVDNDIDAQKNDQDKSLNLYRMNQDALRNDQAAHLATQNQLWSGVQAKVLGATAQAKNPALQLKAQQMMNDIEQQKIQNRMHLGLLSQTDNGQSGGQPGLLKVDPSVLVPEFIKDPAQQKIAFDEIERAQNMAKNRAQMEEYYKTAANGSTLNGGQTVAGLVTHLGADAPALKALKGLMATQFKNLDGTAREFAMHNAENNFLPARGDTDATIKTKHAAFLNWLDSESAAPTVKGASNGAIDLSKFSSTAIAPTLKTKIVNGITYKRGPNGEAIPVS